MTAGGYKGDFGSDYGVGAAHTVSGREPLAVAVFRSRTSDGKAVPWMGLRFAELLGERLAHLAGRAPSTAALARGLATRGLAPQDVGCPPDETDDMAQWGPVLALRADKQWHDTPLELVFGQITVSGVSAAASPAEQGAALLKDGATITVRLRALRNRPQYVVVTSHELVLKAPAREWAQLPARAALALFDDMGVQLTDDERDEYLRAASPLLDAASVIRLRTEGRLGAAALKTLDSRLQETRASRTAMLPAKAALQHKAALSAAAAVRELRILVRQPSAPTRRDGNAPKLLNQSAHHWLAYAESLQPVAHKAKR